MSKEEYAKEVEKFHTLTQEITDKISSVLSLIGQVEESFSKFICLMPDGEIITQDSTSKQEASTEKDATTEPEPTLPEIKEVLIAKARAGYNNEVHSLINSYGVDKLSAIDTSNYRELMRKAKVIGNA